MKKLTLYLVLLLGFTSSTASAQDSKFKALYLMNFTRYLEWPNENVTIGVVGNTPVLLELVALSEKESNVTISKISGDRGIHACDMIFLPEAQTRNFDLIQKSIGNEPIILVAENQGLIKKGAEMAFFMEAQKLKFFVKKDQLDKTGIVMNSRLLSLAKVID